MASLSGNKIKDTFDKLLKLESAQLSASEQVVEDGAGNNSALKLSTDTVETTGNLKISGTPSTSTSDVKALMLSNSGVVVTRNLSTNPIGTASLTASSPLSATGSTIELEDAGNLTQVTSPANNDKYLLWDETASTYVYIQQSDLAAAVSSQLSATQEQSLFARPQQNTVISSTSLTQIQFAEIVGDSSATGSTSQATSSVLFGSGTNSILQLSQVLDPRDSILLNETAGYYKVTVSCELTSGANTNVDLQVWDRSNSVSVARSFRTVNNSDTYHAEFSGLFYSDGLSGVQLQLRAEAGASGVEIMQASSFFKVEYIGANTAF
jgi:hypothetical protein